MKQYQVLNQNCSQASKVLGETDEIGHNDDCHEMDIEHAIISILHNSGHDSNSLYNKRCGLNVLRYHFYYDGIIDGWSDGEIEKAVKCFFK